MLARLKILILKCIISLCDDYGVNANEIWMHGSWFYTAQYGVFSDSGKALQRSPPDNLTRWISHSKYFTRKGIGKVSRSVQAYAYSVFTSQVQAR